MGGHICLLAEVRQAARRGRRADSGCLRMGLGRVLSRRSPHTRYVSHTDRCRGPSRQQPWGAVSGRRVAVTGASGNVNRRPAVVPTGPIFEPRSRTGIEVVPGSQKHRRRPRRSGLLRPRASHRCRGGEHRAQQHHQYRRHPPRRRRTHHRHTTPRYRHGTWSPRISCGRSREEARTRGASVDG
jgi:hypothetical protein